MYAIQPSTPPKKPQHPRRRLSRRSQVRVRPRQNHRAIALETTAKILTNVVLSACAVSALIQILPHHRAANEKWREIQAEVEQTQTRVGRQQEEFGRYFDPQQAQSIMQENGNRIDPRQRQIVWLESGQMTADESELPPSYYAEVEE
jgi:hypothetical protein